MIIKDMEVIVRAEITDVQGDWNFSFEAILVMYLIKTSIPPTMIRNMMYEYQKLRFVSPKISAIFTNFFERIISNSFELLHNISNSL